MSFKVAKEKEGITLIALVITIIVLLILAGVTIATLTGDSGILTKAQEAKESNNQAKENELRRLTALEATTHLTNEDYYDINGDKAVIPAGFAVSQVDGENVIDDGLVIIDKNENEFVWVPVQVYSDFKLYEGYSKGQLQSIYNGNSETYINGYENEKNEYEKMKNSVQKYNGFYVGRYEAGTTAESGTGIRGDLLIKKGANVYNNIKWGNNMNDEKGGAVEVAKGLYPKEKGNSVTSTLIYGEQWDAIMTWIDVKYKTENCDVNTSFVANSAGMGNYSGVLEKTGSNVNYAVKNIYDLAGNVYEWTMESCDSNSRVARGR